MTTYLVLRRTNRIKAAVLGSAIADLFQTAENRPPMEQNVFSELIPDYWATREQALTHRSAIYWVDQLPKQTPLLLLQGSADWRVEPTQTLRMAAALFSGAGARPRRGPATSRSASRGGRGCRTGGDCRPARALPRRPRSRRRPASARARLGKSDAARRTPRIPRRARGTGMGTKWMRRPIP